MNNVLRSDGWKVLLGKFWAPVLCIATSALVFGEDFRTGHFLLAIPFLVAAFFGLTLAVVQVRGGVVYYKRFFTWETLQQDDILEARVEWAPVLGSVRLKRMFLPWGRLYFVLDKNKDGGGEFPLLEYINRDYVHRGDRQSSNPLPMDRGGTSSLIAFATLGILVCLMVLYVSPIDLLNRSLPNPVAGTPALLKVQFQLISLLRSLGVQMVGFVTMLFLALRYRGKRGAFFYAFLCGFALAGIVSRIIP